MTEIKSPAAPVAPASASARLKDGIQRTVRAALDPLVRLIARLGIGPNTLTTLGCIFSVFAAVAFFEGGFRLGSALLAFSGLFDILDGQLARTRQRVSRFGAFLDSTLDRFAEGVVLMGLAGFYLFHLVDLVHDPNRVFEELGRGLEPRTWAVVSLLAMLAMIGSFLVSYTRARAEGLGIECRVGWFERPERLLLIMIAGAFGVGRVMSGALLVLALLSFTTAGQRMIHVWKVTHSR